jgi:hypothetical protein
MNQLAVAAYVEALEAMLGHFASPAMLLMVAEQHDACARWCRENGRSDRAEVFDTVAGAIRERIPL